jgi:hypothetical protein
MKRYSSITLTLINNKIRSGQKRIKFFFKNNSVQKQLRTVQPQHHQEIVNQYQAVIQKAY